MPRTGFKTVEEYIASRPVAVQSVLKKLRSVVHKALPDAEEVISYQIPAYKLHGRIVLLFAGWKDHTSLYPAGARLPDVFKKELERYEISRGTIRFPLSEPIPVNLITRIAKFRAKDATEKAKASSPKKKKKATSKLLTRKRGLS